MILQAMNALTVGYRLFAAVFGDVLYTEEPNAVSDTQRLDAQSGSDVSWFVAHG